MTAPRLLGMVQAGLSVHRALIDIQHVERAREKADALEQYMPVAEASGVLGDARLADQADIEAADLLNPRGLFFGAYKGRMLFYNGTEPLVTYLKTGGGKGRDLILPNLAHIQDRTLVILDSKDGENAAVSYRHRTETLGIPAILLNPFNLWNAGSVCINPVQGLIDIVNSGGVIEDEADEFSHIFVPIPPKATDPWPQEGAREVIALILAYYANFDQERCCPGGIWRFFNASSEETDRSFKMMTICGIESVERAAHNYYAIWKDAPKQWAAYRSAANKNLNPFAAGKPLDRATSRHEFDAKKLKETPHTVYVMVPSKKISTAAIWVSLLVSYLIEEIAQARGPVRSTFILDEMPQMPASDSILKAVKVYREKGVQLWFVSQSRDALRERWPDSAIREFESQAGVMTMKMISEPDLMKDISYWSGTQSVVMRGHNHSGGKLQSASASLSESKRAVLQAEEIMGLGHDSQIVKIAGMPRLLVCNTVSFRSVSPWNRQILDVRDLHRGRLDPFRPAKRDNA